MPPTSPIKALVHETPESSLVPSVMRGHSKKTVIYEPGSGLSPDARSAGVLTLYFPTSRTVRKKFLLCQSYPVYGILMTAAQIGEDNMFMTETFKK